MQMSDGQLTHEGLDHFAAAWNGGRIVRHLGFRISFEEAARVVVEIPEVQPFQRGGLGTDAVNGAVLAGLYDFAIGCVAVLAPPLRRSATIQLSMSFERPVRGSKVRCVAAIDRASSSLVFVSSNITDETGRVCSHASGLVALGAKVDLAEWSKSLAQLGEGS